MDFSAYVVVMFAIVCSVVSRPTHLEAGLTKYLKSTRGNQIGSYQAKAQADGSVLSRLRRSSQNDDNLMYNYFRHEITDLNGTAYALFNVWCDKHQNKWTSSCIEHAQSSMEDAVTTLPPHTELTSATPQDIMNVVLTAITIFNTEVDRIDWLEPCDYSTTQNCEPYYQCKPDSPDRYSMYCQAIGMKYHMSSMKEALEETGHTGGSATGATPSVENRYTKSKYHAAALHWVYTHLDKSGKALTALLSPGQP